MLKYTKKVIRKQANLWDSIKENSNAVLGAGLGGLSTYITAKALGASTPWAVGLGLAGAAAGGYGGSKLDQDAVARNRVEYDGPTLNEEQLEILNHRDREIHPEICDIIERYQYFVRNLVNQQKNRR